MSKIDFRREGVGHLIIDNFMEVPAYQRSYAWEELNVRDLIEDIRNSNFQEYFIGTAVVTPNNNGDLEIVDGQQRIATIYMFFVAIRDLMKEIKDDANANIIENQYLLKTTFGSKDIKQKLKLNDLDNDFFLKRIIQGDISQLPSKESHDRILKAYELIKQFAKNEYNSFGMERITELINFMEKDLAVIMVKVPDDVNAFTIFETLNDRGLALSQTDLIKNYLLNISNDRLQETRIKWTHFTGAIEAAEYEDEVLNYIRYYWSSKYGLTREKELFKNIKNSITNKNAAVTLLSNLDKDSRLYLAILNQDNEHWKDMPKCAEYIKALKDLRLTQNRPLILAILEMFNDSEVEKALKLVLNLSVRTLITGGGGGTLETEFSNLSKKIHNALIKNASELKNGMKNIVPTDELFKKNFMITSFSKSYIARYFLVEIEKYMDNTMEIIPNQNPEKLNLEHILPETISNFSDWPSFNEDSHKSYYKRIGNLTLLDTKMNSDAGNNDFQSKKNIYKDSRIAITKDLCNFNSWSPQDIDNRQQIFADTAANIWNTKFN
ncbi:MAG: DUF262 domain-containing protein [Candidatus Acididesulfobacter guangdongensis]|uniref:DUF262 domain-containing protein n=1 Tax=Acididesulfobacter guangdongensis TaxID=2597225 RepID=A0A519BHF0_ACIG2|nr:MAG: DUF262 domain-containing protein [Candidatus Acididesulfobacter guangdongensis]